MADDVLNVGAAGPSYRWLAGGSIRLTRVRGVPLAGEAFSFSNLGGVHLACSVVAISDGGLSLLTGQSCGREVEPRVRQHPVCEQSLTQSIMATCGP